MQTHTDITLRYLQKTRQLFLAMIRDLSIEELNRIPEGFNNNIIWNLGHIAESTLGLCYIRSQVKPDMALPFAGRFGKGTRPQGLIGEQQVTEIKECIAASLDPIAAEIQSGVFNQVVPYSTDTYQVPMDNIENILNCCLAHENLHLGIAKAQKTLIVRQSGLEKAEKDSKLSLN